MTVPFQPFEQDIIALISQARQRAAVAVNSELTLLIGMWASVLIRKFWKASVLNMANR